MPVTPKHWNTSLTEWYSSAHREIFNDSTPHAELHDGCMVDISDTVIISLCKLRRNYIMWRLLSFLPLDLTQLQLFRPWIHFPFALFTLVTLQKGTENTMLDCRTIPRGTTWRHYHPDPTTHRINSLSPTQMAASVKNHLMYSGTLKNRLTNALSQIVVIDPRLGLRTCPYRVKCQSKATHYRLTNQQVQKYMQLS